MLPESQKEIRKQGLKCSDLVRSDARSSRNFSSGVYFPSEMGASVSAEKVGCGHKEGASSLLGKWGWA